MGHHERPGRWVHLGEARRLLFDVLTPLTPITARVDDSVGAALAGQVIASADVPPFANAQMDGYALRAADTSAAPVRLRVVGSLTAGTPPTIEVGSGEAVAVATGAVVPAGADAVCMIEQTHRDGADVIIEDAVTPGTFVRPVGDDVEAGTSVFASGTVLRPARIALLAALGIAQVYVHPRVRVGVLATGDELVDPPGELRPGQIHDSNRHALLAAARQLGCITVDLGTIGDDPTSIAAALRHAEQECDVILTSGGVSVGVADHMKSVLAQASGGQPCWLEVAIKPGKPFGFAVLQPTGVPVLCVPGNPVSALVSFELLVAPALRFLMGHRWLYRPVISATADEAMSRRTDGKVHFIRVTVALDDSGTCRVRPSGGQGSHQLHGLASASALAVLPDGEGVATGDPVRIILLEAEPIGEEEILQ